MFRAILLALLPLCSIATQAQSKASCTFTLFPLTVNLRNVGPVQLSPAAINDFGTVVGTASPLNNGFIFFGFIRWSNGGFTVPLSKNINNSLVDRNDNGVSIGFRGPFGVPTGQQILVNGTTATPIVLNVKNYDFLVSGINNWGSIVGTYFVLNSTGYHGFKRWSNGRVITVDFPGAVATSLARINGDGAMVGTFYYPANQNGNGFIYHKGSFAKLDYPGSKWTTLVGISNASQIVGNTNVNGSVFSFLYQNGVFNVISVPHAFTTSVLDISPRLGLIIGEATFSTGTTPPTVSKGYIAKCH